MFSISDAKQVGEKKTDVKRITILEADGSETIINVTEDIHYIFGFVKCGPEGGVEVPAEMIVKGDSDIVGELYYQAGVCHPELLAHCRKRVTQSIANAVSAEIKRSGIDPIGEALKKMEPGEKARWN